MVPGSLPEVPLRPRCQAAAAGRGGQAGQGPDRGPDAGQVPDAGPAPGGPHRARGQPRQGGGGPGWLPYQEQVLSATGGLFPYTSWMYISYLNLTILTPFPFYSNT